MVVLAKVRPILVSHAKNPKATERELGPICGPNWNKQLMIKGGSGVINDLSGCAKGAPHPQDKLMLYGNFLRGPFTWR